MVLIRFTDGRGVEWEVWEVTGRRPDDMSRPLAQQSDGWLCFESATDRRRLLTFPRRWYSMSPHELDALCRAATPARITPVVAPRVILADEPPGDAPSAS